MLSSVKLRRVLFLSACAAGAFAPFAAHAEAMGDDAPGIIVYGRPDGYDTDKTPSATKTDTPLVDVPQAVSVISREQLDDQGIAALGDALRYVPGVVVGQGEGHRDQVTLRGQSSTADFFVDGIRDDAQYYRPLYNIERVEVLKGANALIFGRGGGGGVINRVSKAPEFDRLKGSVAGSVDSLGAWSIAADIGAPLSDGVGLRLNGIYEAFDNHRQDYDGHFIGFTPTVGFKLGDNTTLVATYEYAEDRRLTDRGVPSLNGAPLTGYDDTLFGSTATNRSEVTAHLAHARLDHTFSNALSANFSVQYATYDKFYSNVFAGGAVNAAANTVALSGYTSGTQRDNLIAQGNLVWKAETGGIGHTLLMGFEAGDQNTAADRYNPTFAGSATVALAQRLTIPAVTFTTLTNNATSNVRTLSGYIQDQIDIGEHVKIVAGLRYDNFRISALNKITGVSTGRTDAKWSPRLGLVLKPQENLSVYASFAKSFLPQSGDQFGSLDPSYQALAPESFRNLEAGVKWDVTDALAFTVAAYQLDRTNTRATDPVTGNVVLAGATRAKGIEASLVGQLARHLQVSLGYALQDGEVLSATTAAPAGRRLAQLPRHQLSAWTRYDLTKRFGIGLGLLHQSSQYTTISNAVTLPAFTRLDAALYYDLSDTVALQLNVENLTDIDYFPSAHTDNNITTGKPLNAKLTLRAKF